MKGFWLAVWFLAMSAGTMADAQEQLPQRFSIVSVSPDKDPRFLGLWWRIDTFTGALSQCFMSTRIQAARILRCEDVAGPYPTTPIALERRFEIHLVRTKDGLPNPNMILRLDTWTGDIVVCEQRKQGMFCHTAK